MVKAVNVLMNLDEDIVQQRNTDTSKVLAALELQISSVQKRKGNYSQISENVGIKVVKINTQCIKINLNFGTFMGTKHLSVDVGYLHENNTRLFDGVNDLDDVKTIISVPKKVLNLFTHGAIFFLLEIRFQAECDDIC